MSQLILGIDDAGRGPIIGPMVLAGVLVTEEQQSKLKKEGVKDSKVLEHKKRISLAKIIQKNSIDYKVILIPPSEIDKAVDSGYNLNTLEAEKMAEIINSINVNGPRNKRIKVIVDCPSPNIPVWTNTLKKFIEHKDNLDIKCEHKADVNHPSVSAASIMAKVAREEEIAEIKKNFGEVGSGYAADPITIEFLEKNGHDPKNESLFRKSWATWKIYKAKKEQKKLGDF